MCGRESLKDDARGRNTVWVLYEAEMAAYRGQGQRQDYETTNQQRQRALERLGRPRCRRTVQYARRRLELMGLVSYHHVKRRQWREGHKDSLRVHLHGVSAGNARGRARANCTPPPPTGSEAGAAPLQGDAAPARRGIPPAFAGKERPFGPDPPPFGGERLRDEDWDERVRFFAELRRAIRGFRRDWSARGPT